MLSIGKERQENNSYFTNVIQIYKTKKALFYQCLNTFTYEELKCLLNAV